MLHQSAPGTLDLGLKIKVMRQLLTDARRITAEGFRTQVYQEESSCGDRINCLRYQYN